MNGLNLNDPLFLYRHTAAGFQQLTYFLRWNDNNMESFFTIYCVDPETGVILPLKNGKGFSAYLAAVHDLSTKGVRRSDIVWGGEPTEADKLRLGMPAT